jgi:2-polyprenyl-6-methoxyphenol hydroxylase-like FAD-dependent oxidoreductase
MLPASSSLSGRQAVVIGGGITGLAAALTLSTRGAQVTILERDPAPTVNTATAAFQAWKRAGAPQVRHSHVFLGRLRNLVRDHYPELLEALLAAGAREMRMTDRPPPSLAGLKPEPGDDDLVALGCRRTTFEWIMRQTVLRTGRVTMLSSTTVHGLAATATRPPIVFGVRYRAGGRTRELDAHLVVDASGRRSAAPAWLQAIGARPHYEKLEQSGIVYYTRFYRMRPGAQEPAQGEHPTAGDFNWVKFAVFPADDHTFSITLAVPLAIPRLKILAHAGAFDEMVQSIPGLAPWIASDFAEPIGDKKRPVQAMGGLINRLRRFVDADGPVAARFFVLGDAAYCTNPLYGRGCSQGLLHAHFLAEALEQHRGDYTAAAVALDERARAELEPFYRASVLADRDSVRRAEGRAPRDLRRRMEQRFFEDGVGIAMRCDAVVFRAVVRMMNMLETPARAFGQPAVIARCLWVLARREYYKGRFGLPAPPDREQTIARCEAALAG